LPFAWLCERCRAWAGENPVFSYPVALGVWIFVGRAFPERFLTADHPIVALRAQNSSWGLQYIQLRSLSYGIAIGPGTTR
jgi:hypothetical protein